MRSRGSWFTSFAVFALISGCEPPDRSGTVRAWVYARDPASNQYSLRVDEVKNLFSLRELKGRDFAVRRGANIELTFSSLVEGKLDIDRGVPMSLEYTVEAEGVVVPGDAHTLQALTLYRSLDRTATLLRELGHVQQRPLMVFYMPRYDNVVAGDTRAMYTDNAAFLFAAHGFLIMPSFLLSDLPLMLNEGVVAHEYGHAVIHQELFGAADEMPHQTDTATEWVVAQRHLLSMHEGVADIIGFVATGDPNFIGPSADAKRDLSEHSDFVAADLAELDRPPPRSLEDLFDSLTFDPHRHGSILARAIFELWPKDADEKIAESERRRLLGVSLAALRELKYQAGTFTLASFPDALVATLPDGEKPGACAVLRARLAPLAARLTRCPP